MPKSARKSGRKSALKSSRKYTKKIHPQRGLRFVAHPTLRKAQTLFGEETLKNDSYNRQGISLKLKRHTEDMGSDGSITYYRFEATVKDNATKKIFFGFKEEWEMSDMFPWHTFGAVAPYMTWRQISG